MGRLLAMAVVLILSFSGNCMALTVEKKAMIKGKGSGGN